MHVCAHISVCVCVFVCNLQKLVPSVHHVRPGKNLRLSDMAASICSTTLQVLFIALKTKSPLVRNLIKYNFGKRNESFISIQNWYLWFHSILSECLWF